MHTSDIVGTRVFENPWPVTTAYQQRKFQQLSPPTPTGSIFTPISHQEKPSTGIGITRFARGTFFPPGPQKSYHRKSSSLSMQNNSLKSHLTTSVSERSPDSSREPLTSTATRRPNYFEQWRSGQCNIVDTDNGGLENAEIRCDSDEDPSDEDGGVTLASSLAIFMQGPGEIRPPLHRTTPKADTTNQCCEIEHQKPKLEGPKPQDAGVTKKTVQGPRPSINSQVAVLLQTPGALSSMSRPSIPVPPVSYTPPTNYPVYRPSMEPERETQEEKEIYKPETRSRSAHVETISIDESGDTPNTPSVDKYEDIDTDRYWRTPGTSFVYLRSTSTRPTILPTIPPKQSRSPEPERSERRAFRYWRDGDIVGNEAFELPKANKGRLMMEKMGYKEGTTLGTNGDRGLTEPVKVEVRLGKRGLGLAKEEPVLPTQASASRVNLNQIILPRIVSARVDEEENTHAIASQFQQMDVIALQQAMKYSLITPLSACQTRLRLVQILAQLDALELLNIVAYNYILTVSMDRVAELLLRLRFLVDADLIQIVTREYRMAILRADQKSGSNYEKMNKTGYW
ncbi:squalene synthetase-like protein [Maublancomyces gigas]|uniref:Squalene synthetase-like protein n=1 Tax=Discina gigas TaxID=1032678 RepID=A0ABR3GEU7_9PEZI